MLPEKQLVHYVEADTQGRPSPLADVNTKDFPGCCATLRVPGAHVHPEHSYTVRPTEIDSSGFRL